MYTTHAMYDEKTDNTLKDIFIALEAQHNQAMQDTINVKCSRIPIIIPQEVDCCLNWIFIPCQALSYPCRRHAYDTAVKAAESSADRLEKEKQIAFNNWMDYRRSANVDIHNNTLEKK